METEGHAELIEALQRFLDDAAQVIEMQRGRGGLGRMSVQTVAPSLAALPTCIEASAVARKASLAANYLLPKPAGRPLDADALISTGVVGMLLDRVGTDFHDVASDLAGYLAGPPTEIWDYAILDGCGTLPDAIQVVDGWELVTPSADELRMLLPLPSTAAYQPARPFDPDDYRRLAMLRRRVDRDATDWTVFYSLAVGHPERLLWQPLTALSLYANPVLQLWARYRIAPRRQIYKLFDSVEWEVWTPDGETEIERPRTGAFYLDASATPTLRRFLAELAPLLTAALGTQITKKGVKETATKAANRLRVHSGVLG